MWRCATSTSTARAWTSMAATPRSWFAGWSGIALASRRRSFGDGLQTMDMVHVSDVARANILGRQSAVSDDVLNIGSGAETSLLELAIFSRVRWAARARAASTGAERHQSGAAAGRGVRSAARGKSASKPDSARRGLYASSSRWWRREARSAGSRWMIPIAKPLMGERKPTAARGVLSGGLRKARGRRVRARVRRLVGARSRLRGLELHHRAASGAAGRRRRAGRRSDHRQPLVYRDREQHPLLRRRRRSLSISSPPPINMNPALIERAITSRTKAFCASTRWACLAICAVADRQAPWPSG